MGEGGGVRGGGVLSLGFVCYGNGDLLWPEAFCKGLREPVGTEWKGGR